MYRPARAHPLVRRASAHLLFVVLAGVAGVATAAKTEELSSSVTIHRDEWGVPHIDGPTDESVVFGFAYAQAEDYFWQIEDTYLQCIGRYAEVIGESGLESDLLNHTFEMAAGAQADFPRLEPKLQGVCTAYAAGLRPGDIITLIGSTLVRNSEEFSAIAEQLPANTHVPVRLIRGGQPGFVAIRIEE